jgi:hypothetical protein
MVHPKMDAPYDSALVFTTAKDALERFCCPFWSRKTVFRLSFASFSLRSLRFGSTSKCCLFGAVQGDVKVCSKGVADRSGKAA